MQAYFLWEKNGRPWGEEEAFWFQAERILWGRIEAQQWRDEEEVQAVAKKVAATTKPGSSRAKAKASTKAKRPKALNMDMYPESLQQALVDSGALSDAKPPTSKAAKAATKAAAKAAAKAGAKAVAKAAGKAKATPAKAPSTPAATSGTVSAPTVAGWLVKTFTYSATSTKAGKTYKMFVSPDGKTYRTVSEAKANGYDG